ncbi:MAG TPA: cytochrome c family protein [Rhizomicrobium sp.]|jgi:cytochrome c|nr:cytochrome c family protein [Rhizomicrobium sp.]
MARRDWIARGAAAVTLCVTLAAEGHAADAAKGKQVFARCAICHKAEKNAGNAIGPNLFGVVGRKAGTAPAFAYSAAMKNAGFVWTPEKLNEYITHPAQVVPGNRMAFAGVSDPQQRADLIAYLSSLK